MNKSLIPIYIIYFLDNFGSSIVIPFFAPLFLGDVFLSEGASHELRNILLGFGIAMFPLAQFFGAPFFGDFADVWGRKKALYYTIAGTALGYILSAIGIIIGSLTLLLGSRLVTGFFAGNVSICFAAIADLHTDEKRRAKYFGYISLVGGVSWIFGIMFGGFFSDQELSTFFDPSMTFFVTAALTLLGIPILHIYFQETFNVKKRVHFSLLKGFHHVKQAFIIPTLQDLFLLYLFWVAGFFLSIDWYPAIGIQEYGMTQFVLTLWLTLFGVLWVVGSSWVNQFLLKRLSIYAVTKIGLIGMTLCLFLSAIPNQYYLYTLAYALANLFAAFTWPNLVNTISAKAKPEDQGTVMGITSSMQAVGWLFVPILGGVIAARCIEWVMTLSGILLVIPLILYRRRCC